MPILPLRRAGIFLFNMKLVIQIPCYNEEENIAVTLACLPRKVKGCSSVEWLIIDDGSIDRTAEVARECGVDHVVRLPQNAGLARGFSAGLEYAVSIGADVIVNTDADNQYNADDIEKIIVPILNCSADIVVGERPISAIEHFSFVKKILQKFGSFVTRKLSGTNVKDAPSGFRAFSRSAASRLNVFSEYTYTLETIIQAGQNGMAITSLPVRVNGETRPSKLVKSIFQYVKRSAITMGRIFLVYRPMRFFVFLALASLASGLGLGIRYLLYYIAGEGAGHIQSVILSALFVGASLLFLMIGIIADLISVNRRLMEKIQWKLSKLEDMIQGRDHSH
ncbi:glycosyl transferase, group 2 family protein [Verrucomicrobiia bacterium DG1235]|nr:glycosyl transferase, group 2 family protein [Verrucomicrobiae bacterium DG1235]